MMKSKAIIINEKSNIKIHVYDVPEIDEFSVLIKVVAAPFSSSYLSGKGQEKYNYSYIPGSEAIGEVISIGTGAREEYGINEGDLVFVEPVILCKKCNYCLRGNYALCVQKKFYGHLNFKVYPFLLGSFSQYMVLLPGSRIHKLDEKIPLEYYTLTGSFARAIKCILKKGKGRIGKSIIVFGFNIFSLACALVAKVSGLDPVTIVGKDLSPSERELATYFNLEIVSSIKKDRQYHLLVNTHESNDLGLNSKMIFNLIMPEGKYLIPAPYWDKEFTFSQSQLANKELEIIGISNYSWDIMQALNLINHFVLQLEKIPYKYYCLEEIDAAREMNTRKKMMNIIIQPNKAD